MPSGGSRRVEADTDIWSNYGTDLLYPKPLPLFNSLHASEHLHHTRQQIDLESETCQIHGHFDTNKVPGNFHIGVHHMSALYSPYYNSDSLNMKNMRHTISRLAFTEVTTNATLIEKQPLDGFKSPKAFTFQYYLTVSPSTVIESDGNLLNGYQFRAGSFVTNELTGPAIFFRLGIDPIRVTYYTQVVQLNRFFVNLCAIVGGCLAVCNMIEKIFFNAAAIV